MIEFSFFVAVLAKLIATQTESPISFHHVFLRSGKSVTGKMISSVRLFRVPMLERLPHEPSKGRYMWLVQAVETAKMRSVFGWHRAESRVLMTRDQECYARIQFGFSNPGASLYLLAFSYEIRAAGFVVESGQKVQCFLCQLLVINMNCTLWLLF